MEITNLPLDIWIIIINYLDTKSKINLYKTNTKIRSFFVPNHVKKVILSRSTMGSIGNLDQALLSDFGQYILELNLSGVPNLTAEAFLPYVTRLEHLFTLDVTFTNIYLSDLLTRLKNIGINFFKCATGYFKLREKWDRAKQVFVEHQFLNVHFIVFDFLDSRFPLLFVDELTPIEDLEVDIVDNEKYCETRLSYAHREEVTYINFSRLSYLFRDCVFVSRSIGNFNNILKIDFESIEYIFLMYSKNIVIYVSPIFEQLFLVNAIVKVKVEKILPRNIILEGNVLFKAWNKSTNNFDDANLERIRQDCKNYFPIYICMHNNEKITILNASTNWYCLDKCENFENIFQNEPEKLTLTNQCRLYNFKKSATLSNFHEWERIINITFLRISNLSVGEEFFIQLFARCKRINTLDINVYNPKSHFPAYISSLALSMGQTSSLKNIKLTLEYTEYEVLFDALSKCSTLENIHICDFVREFDYIDVNPAKIYTLLGNCKNLYSLFIEADTSPQMSTILFSSIYEAVQRLELFHLFVDVNTLYYAWNPFIDVFNPSPLQIMD